MQLKAKFEVDEMKQRSKEWNEFKSGNLVSAHISFML